VSKHKPLDQCKTWTDFERAAEDSGLRYDRTTGGHDIYRSNRGSISFSTHERGELSKSLRHSLVKQILALVGTLAFIVWIFTFMI
jgi:hypothetical protein